MRQREIDTETLGVGKRIEEAVEMMPPFTNSASCIPHYLCEFKKWDAFVKQTLVQTEA